MFRTATCARAARTAQGRAWGPASRPWIELLELAQPASTRARWRRHEVGVTGAVSADPVLAYANTPRQPDRPARDPCQQAGVDPRSKREESGKPSAAVPRGLLARGPGA